jgi:hypothetical protein
LQTFAKFAELDYGINNSSKVAKTENISMNLKKPKRQKCFYQGLRRNRFTRKLKNRKSCDTIPFKHTVQPQLLFYCTVVAGCAHKAALFAMP